LAQQPVSQAGTTESTRFPVGTTAFSVPLATAQPQLPHSQTSQVQNSPLQSGQRQSVQPQVEAVAAPEVAAKPKPVAAANNIENKANRFMA
jgi:hypothetical protein